MTAIGTQGSASVQGELWDARAQDYADYQESQCRPLYQQALRLTGIGRGSSVLDVGCGPGGFGRLAADAGARVSGIDAAEKHVEIAKRRVPLGDFRVGDMQSLPYGDGSFDAITGFNSFQYAADPVAALAEAARVGKPGATVLVVVWGREEHTDLVAALRALRPLLPPAPDGARGPFALSYPGGLEALAERSGLTPADSGYIDITFEYPDQETLLKGNRSNGPVVLAEHIAGETAVIEALCDAFEPFRTSTGAYRIETEWRYLTARIE